MVRRLKGGCPILYFVISPSDVTFNDLHLIAVRLEHFTTRERAKGHFPVPAEGVLHPSSMSGQGTSRGGTESFPERGSPLWSGPGLLVSPAHTFTMSRNVSSSV